MGRFQFTDWGHAQNWAALKVQLDLQSAFKNPDVLRDAGSLLRANAELARFFSFGKVAQAQLGTRPVQFLAVVNATPCPDFLTQVLMPYSTFPKLAFYEQVDCFRVPRYPRIIREATLISYEGLTT
jgi:hypothetical protein